MLSAVLRIESSDAGVIATTLEPEVGRELPRTHVSMEKDADALVIMIEATDTSAMRAALNSYLGCIKITEDLNQITGD